MATIETSMDAEPSSRTADIPAACRRTVSWSESIVSGLVGAADALALTLIGLLYYSVFPGWSTETY
jgi:hypothetical protein